MPETQDQDGDVTDRKLKSTSLIHERRSSTVDCAAFDEDVGEWSVMDMFKDVPLRDHVP